jgi:hypothetical protein
MSQQGQLFRIKRTGRDGQPLWAYRYRLGGRGSRRVQRGGFASERDAAEALERELERLRRERRVARSLTLAELVETYLVQHDVEPVTIEKLRWLLGRRLPPSASDRSASCGRRGSPPGGSERCVSAIGAVRSAAWAARERGARVVGWTARPLALPKTYPQGSAHP